MTIAICSLWHPWPRVRQTPTLAEVSQLVRTIYELAGAGPALDLGAGSGLHTEGLAGTTYIDLVPSVSPLFQRPIVIAADIRRAHEIPAVAAQRFNLAVLLDILPYLSKDDGFALLRNLAGCCAGALVLCPTAGRLDDPALQSSDNPDVIRSQWTPEEFWANGWTVLELPAFYVFDHTPTGFFFAWKLARHASAEDVCMRAGISLR